MDGGDFIISGMDGEDLYPRWRGCSISGVLSGVWRGLLGWMEDGEDFVFGYREKTSNSNLLWMERTCVSSGMDGEGVEEDRLAETHPVPLNWLSELDRPVLLDHPLQ